MNKLDISTFVTRNLFFLICFLGWCLINEPRKEEDIFRPCNFVQARSSFPLFAFISCYLSLDSTKFLYISYYYYEDYRSKH